MLTGTKGLEFKLEREAQIEGRLSYVDSGAPVESATISVESIRPIAAGGQASVDANGHYAVRNLPPGTYNVCLLYTSPSPRDGLLSRMPSSA